MINSTSAWENSPPPSPIPECHASAFWKCRRPKWTTASSLAAPGLDVNTAVAAASQRYLSRRPFPIHFILQVFFDTSVTCGFHSRFKIQASSGCISIYRTGTDSFRAGPSTFPCPSPCCDLQRPRILWCLLHSYIPRFPSSQPSRYHHKPHLTDP